MYSFSVDFGLGIATPLPKKKAQNRFGRSAAGSAFAIASNQGNANDRPAPRRNVRRSRCQERRAMGGHLQLYPITILSVISSEQELERFSSLDRLLRLKGLAGDDQFDECREPVFTSAKSRHQSVRGINVARGKPPTQGVSHELASHRPPEVVGPRADQLFSQLFQ